jgi:predicted 2-oxoglutarate/Fe(II)-dependent dioxygenase YbiX
LNRAFNSKATNAFGPIIKKTWRANPGRYGGTHIVRYQTGGFYVSHADAGLDLNDRYFTILCYLNDEFTGGHTSFPTLGFSVTPRKGKAIMFPSTYVHRAEPVIEGTKYILVSWLMGPDPPKWI